MQSYPLPDITFEDLSMSDYRKKALDIAENSASHISTLPSVFNFFFFIPDLPCKDGPCNLIAFNPIVSNWASKINQLGNIGGGRFMFFFRKSKSKLSVVVKDMTKVGKTHLKVVFKDILDIDEVLTESEWDQLKNNFDDGIAKTESEFLDNCHPATAKIYFEDVFKAKTKKEVVDTIFRNFEKAGRNGTLKYVASSRAGGMTIIRGGKEGMCETYADAMLATIVIFNHTLRFTHPVEEIRNDTITASKNLSLSENKILTVKGLELMGGLKGNIHYQIEGNGKIVLKNNVNSINQYIFSSHWTIDAEGSNYDLIFYTIDKNNVDHKLDGERKYGNTIFLIDMDRKPPGGEFLGYFVKLSEVNVFEDNLEAFGELFSKQKIELANVLKKKMKDSPLVGTCEKLMEKIEPEGFELLMKCALNDKHSKLGKLVLKHKEAYEIISKVAAFK